MFCMLPPTDPATEYFDDGAAAWELLIGRKFCC